MQSLDRHGTTGIFESLEHVTRKIHEGIACQNPLLKKKRWGMN
jgi:hypothetical protein